MARGAPFHASEAILYDSLGAAGMAIHHYRIINYSLFKNILYEFLHRIFSH